MGSDYQLRADRDYLYGLATKLGRERDEARAERDRLSLLLRGMAKRVSEFRRVASALEDEWFKDGRTLSAVRRALEQGGE